MNIAYQDFKTGMFKAPEELLPEINKWSEDMAKNTYGFKIVNIETLYSTSVTGNIEKGFRVWYQTN